MKFHPSFLLVGSKTVSLIGDAVFLLGFPLLLYQKTGSAAVLGYSLTLEMSIYMVFSLIGGAISDRFGSVRFCVSLDFMRFVLLMGFYISYHHSSGFNLGAAMTLMSLLCALTAIYNISFDSLPLRLFSGDVLTKILADIQALSQVLELAGAALGGAVLGVTGLEGALWVNGVSFLGSGLLLMLAAKSITSRLPRRESKPLTWKGAVETLGNGFRVTLKIEGIRYTLLLALAMNLACAVKDAQWLFLLKGNFGLTPWQIGIVNSLSAAGFVIAMTLLRSRLGNGLSLKYRLLLVGQGLVVLGVFALGLNPGIITVCLLSFLINAGTAFHALPSSILRKDLIPMESVGSALAAARVMSRLMAPLAMSLSVLMLRWGTLSQIFIGFASLALVMSVYPAISLCRLIKPKGEAHGLAISASS